jgi:hypothetical protein
LFRPLKAIGRGLSELFLDMGSGQSRRGTVTGSPGGLAVQFADAHARRTDIAWLLWSRVVRPAAQRLNLRLLHGRT